MNKQYFYFLFSFLKCSSVQSPNRVRLFPTPWTAAHQASLSFTVSWSLLKLMSIKLMMPSNPLILCRPLLLLPSVFPSIRVFSNESVLKCNVNLILFSAKKNSDMIIIFFFYGYPCNVCLFLSISQGTNVIGLTDLNQ